jgi:hypothetical protein
MRLPRTTHQAKERAMSDRTESLEEKERWFLEIRLRETLRQAWTAFYLGHHASALGLLRSAVLVIGSGLRGAPDDPGTAWPALRALDARINLVALQWNAYLSSRTAAVMPSVRSMFAVASQAERRPLDGGDGFLMADLAGLKVGTELQTIPVAARRANAFGLLNLALDATEDTASPLPDRLARVIGLLDELADELSYDAEAMQELAGSGNGH